MKLQASTKYKVKIQVEQFLQGVVATKCSNLLRNNLNFLDHLTCSTAGKFIEIVFNPPDEITDDYLFETIIDILRNASLTYVEAVLSVYVGTNSKTLTGSVLGGLAGLRFGPWGGMLGALVGAGATKVLFDWKNVCECFDEGSGHFIIRYFEN